jgi:hypothetical protein
MNCTTCNAELKVGAATCLECGAAVASVPSGPPKDRAFGDWVNLAVRCIKMEEAATLEAARDDRATQMAFIFFAISGAAPAIGTLAIFGAIVSVPAIIVMSLIGVGVTHIIAGLIGGKGEYWHLFRVQGLCAMISWVGAVPILGPLLGILAGLYGLAVAVFNVKTVYKLPLTHAIAVIILPLVLCIGFMIAAFMALGVMVAAFSHGAH